MSNDPQGNIPSWTPDEQQGTGNAASAGSASNSPAYPYGQQPSSAYPQPPAYPQQGAYQSYGQQPYPQQPAYPQQGAYPQQPYPPQSAPQQSQQQWDTQQPSAYGYGTTTAYPTAQAPVKPPALGIAAFLSVIVLGIIMSVVLYNWGVNLAEILMQYGDSYDTAGIDDLPLDVQNQLYMGFMPSVVIGVLGFVAWILCIVATASQRGRGWGIGGIVVGVLVPFIACLFIFLGVLAVAGTLA